jgi:predicted phage-related endonuclease
MCMAGERKVTWKTITSQRLDTKKLQTEHPDSYAQFMKESSYRRFSIK